jgi:hypothetical protein
MEPSLHKFRQTISGHWLCQPKIEESRKTFGTFSVRNVCLSMGEEHFTHYLIGRHFALFTDHKPLFNLGAVHTKALSQIQEAM